jgi:adenylyltransferase/sulfurtransferase
VLGPVPGVFGGLQAFEAMKLLLDLPGQLKDELLVLDLLTLSTSRVRTRRATSCPEHAVKRAVAAQAASASTTVDGEVHVSADAGARGATLGASGITADAGGARAGTSVELAFDTLDHAYDAGFDIVDIREPHELQEIPTPSSQSRNIPLAQLLHGQPPFTPTRKTLLVCATGRRSLAATQELRERGLSDIYSLQGGVKGLQTRLLT